MCFKTKGSKIRKADADIICYKEMRYPRNDFDEHFVYESLFRQFLYKPNVIYGGKSKLKMFLCWLFNINIHSVGYHSYIKPYHTLYKPVKCIIPKDSFYLMDDYEFCSTAIKVIGDI